MLFFPPMSVIDEQAFPPVLSAIARSFFGILGLQVRWNHWRTRRTYPRPRVTRPLTTSPYLLIEGEKEIEETPRESLPFPIFCSSRLSVSLYLFIYFRVVGGFSLCNVAWMINAFTLRASSSS